jgi:hypothetical protein
MDIDDMAARAMNLVRDYVLDRFRAEFRYDRRDALAHLAQCPSTRANLTEAEDGSYGCETGCEYARFTALFNCDHDHVFSYEYGEFGDLAMLIEDLEARHG